MLLFVEKCKKYFPLILLVFYGFFILFFIIIKPGLIIHGDVKFPWNIGNFIESGRYLFSDHFGDINGMEVMGRWNTMTVFSEIFNFFGLSTNFLIKFLFVFTTFLSLFSFFYFSKWMSEKMTKKNINPYFLVLLSIFFTSNPWILNQIQAWGYWIAYVCTPIMIMLFYKYLESLKFKYLLMLTILISIISAGPQYLLYTFVLLLIYFLSYILLLDNTILKKLKLYLHLTICIVIFILLSAPWFFTVLEIFNKGLYMTTGYGIGASDVNTGMILEFSRNSTIRNIFTGYDQWVSWFQLDIKTIFQKILTLVPFGLFIYSIFIFKDKNKNKIDFNEYFFISTVISTLLFATFAYGPHIPGYIEFATWGPIASTIGFALRTAYKLSYFIFIGYSIIFLLIYTKLNKISRLIFSLILIIYFIFVPFVKTIYYYWEYYAPINQPVYYQELYAFLDNYDYDKNSKIIWLAPYTAGWGKNNLKWETSFTWNPERNAQHTPETSSKFVNISWYHLTFKNWMTLYKKFDPDLLNTQEKYTELKNVGKEYLADANIKYLIYHNDIVGGENSGNETVKQLINNSDLELVKQFDNKIFVFKNPYTKNILYTDNKDNIKINKINPTEYDFEISIDKPEYIYFAQQFDQFWQMSIGNEIINPENAYDYNLIKYKINRTGNVKGKIIYFPQKFYELGLKISEVTLVICFIYLGFDYIKRRKKIKN